MGEREASRNQANKPAAASWSGRHIKTVSWQYLFIYLFTWVLKMLSESTCFEIWLISWKKLIHDFIIWDKVLIVNHMITKSKLSLILSEESNEHFRNKKWANGNLKNYHSEHIWSLKLSLEGKMLVFFGTGVLRWRKLFH